MQRSRNTHAIFIRALIAAAVAVAFWRFDVVVETLRAGVFAVAAPLWRTEQALSGTTEDARAALFASRKRLSEENRVLTEENVLLKVRLAFEALVLEENRELKEILGRRESANSSLLALVLSHPGRSPYDTLVVDAGADAGVEAGNIVRAYGNTTIGVVERVYAKTSVAKLFSSSGEMTEAFLGPSDTPVRAEGTGGGAFYAEVPRDIEAAEGDFVTVASAEAPLLGVVQEIRAAPSDSFQAVLFRTPVNVYELKWVEVILGTSYPPDDGREDVI